MAQMAKGGIVMDVVNAEQARIAEDAGVNVFLFCFSTFNMYTNQNQKRKSVNESSIVCCQMLTG